MARRKSTKTKRPIESYRHADKERVNNPPVGLVTPDTDPDAGPRTYAYDPHLDPQLQWAGKAEHTSFEVPTVSLHVHERTDPRTIVEAVRRQPDPDTPMQLSLFQTPQENPPIRQAIEFYRHKHGWSNRLVAGDSLLVMNSLLEKEGLAGQVQMIYIDPPYGIKYGSNFQPFVNQTALKSTDKDEDLTAEPEMIKAFRDTWELGIHSYLTYLRDRVLLSRGLLSDTGSIFVQISDENLHRVRLILDEVLGEENFVSLITIKKGSVMFAKKLLNNACFYVIWYAKNKGAIKYRQLFTDKDLQWFADNAGSHLWAENTKTKECRKATPAERSDINEFLVQDPDWRIFGTWSLNAQGTEKQKAYHFEGKDYYPPRGTQWKTSYPDGLDKLKDDNRLLVEGNTLRVKLYPEDYPVMAINNIWEGIGAASNKIYVVQTSEEIARRCVLMTTDPSDLVFDPTCGSGTTAFVAEQWGRRWITCDTSRVALTLARTRLMTAVYDYYELAHPQEGVGSGFKYKTVPHVTLGSIAKNEPPGQETLYDQPIVNRKITRVSGPFTVEAVPAPAVQSVEDILSDKPQAADTSVARSGETLRQAEWRDELLKTGLRGKAGQHIRFARLEPLPGCRWLHADGETRPSTEGADSVREDAPAYNPMRVVVSFGPEHAPLEQRQVASALEEAQTLVPKPKLIIFASFQFDPEAAKDIDETRWPGVTLLKAQMNADLLTDDLRKKRTSNESFWLIGQPDVQVERIAKGPHKGKVRVSVHGFDYYNTKTGDIESGGADKIAVWLLDTDFDGRSLFPRQVFFPLAGPKEGWARLARNLKAEIDPDLIEAYRSTVSLPFEPGEHRSIAVKIVDDRGIESLKVVGLD